MGPAEPREKSFKTILRCSSMLDHTLLKHSGGTGEKLDGLPIETMMHHDLQHCVASFVNQHGMIVQLEKMKQQQSCVQYRLAQSSVEVVKKMRY